MALAEGRYLWTVPGTAAHHYTGAVWDPSGERPSIVATDGDRHVVVRISLEGKETVLAGIPGQRGFNGDHDSATHALVDAPEHPIVARDGTIDFMDRPLSATTGEILYTSDSGRIRRITRDGALVTIAGPDAVNDDASLRQVVVTNTNLILGEDGIRFLGGYLGLIPVVPVPGEPNKFSRESGRRIAIPRVVAKAMAGAEDGSLYLFGSDGVMRCVTPNRGADGVRTGWTQTTIAGGSAHDELDPNLADAALPNLKDIRYSAIAPNGHVYVLLNIISNQQLVELVPPGGGQLTWSNKLMATSESYGLDSYAKGSRAPRDGHPVKDRGFERVASFAAVPGDTVIFTTYEDPGIQFLGSPNDNKLARAVDDAVAAQANGNVAEVKRIRGALSSLVGPGSGGVLEKLSRTRTLSLKPYLDKDVLSHINTFHENPLSRWRIQMVLDAIDRRTARSLPK
jgi:hypothetical protein